MKGLKNIMFLALIGVFFVSCLSEDDPYQAGFSFSWPETVRTNVYANTFEDSVLVTCMGPWNIKADTEDATWCRMGMHSGRGATINKINVSFDENTTGQPRLMQWTIRDTDHPDDAYASWQYLQYASRGDGSMGTASDVTHIKGTYADGTDYCDITIAYDGHHRPTKLYMTKGGTIVADLTLDFNDGRKQLTVTTGTASKLTGSYGYDFQPVNGLSSSSESMVYQGQLNTLYFYYTAMTNAFNIIHSRGENEYSAYAYLLNGQSLQPDSIHNADSLRYRHQFADKTVYDRWMKLDYNKAAPVSNLHQSVDANQLILGIDDCNPYLLLSLFRYARNSYVVRQAHSEQGTITVTPTLDADGRRLKTLNVADAAANTNITYTFDY